MGEAEALLATLPGIISARGVTTRQGGVSEVHVLTGADVAPRQTVRTVENALLARFGARVDQRRISVATTTGPMRRPGSSQGPLVAARAALDALARREIGTASFALEGSAKVAAFGREFVLIGVVARQGREVTLLTSSAEIKEGGTETSAVLAILDATNRWVARCAGGGGTARAA